jgi:integrase
MERGELTVNPAVKAKRYKDLENARTPELSFKEEDDLRAVIRKRYPHKEAEFDLALHLGCRRSNLYGQHNGKRTPMEPLQWKDVNLDFRIVRFKRSKSGKAYQVPINDTALAAFKKLRERCDGTGAVIRKPSGIELQSSRRWFENCLTEAKIEDFHWHDFRHVFGSRLRAANVQIEDIRYLLGRGAKSITERYAHPNMDVLRLAVAKLDRKPAAQTDTKTDTVPVLEFPTAVGA